ncbi:MAG TPA: class I SAM-dependent methyltransferase [Solirubrobacteraceae bacterium]|jgi:SAM-dependent methyltransferase|nr:class I SAM-dependent methyltransferase [Solirubrobacteraceae bacterium]
MSPPPFPHPPAELANYVGRLTSDRPELEYEQIGTAARQFVLGMLPRDLSLDGSRVLDFGCGAGRVIRHFDQDAANAEIWGCDIDAASIAWATEHLSPPFQFALSSESPPLPFPDSHFDLIYAISVYTHLVDSWSDWMLEMHRLLRPGGFLVFSFLGRGMSMDIARVPWDEEKIGMIPVKIATPWSEGGPCVLHSPWWLRAHLGRAFDVIDLVPDGTALTRFVAKRASGEDDVYLTESDNPPGDGGHGMIALRKDDRPAPTREQLEAPEPGEPREFAAMSFAVRHLAGEVTLWREQRNAEHARAQWMEQALPPNREAQPPDRSEPDLRPTVESLIDRAQTSIDRL